MIFIGLIFNKEFKKMSFKLVVRMVWVLANNSRCFRVNQQLLLARKMKTIAAK